MRGEYSGLGRRVSFKPGQRHTVTIGASEAAMHLRVAGKTLPVRLLPGGLMAQIYDERGRTVSFPVTAGEAGLYGPDAQGRYYGYREQPEIEAARAIRRAGSHYQQAEWMRNFEREHGAARTRRGIAATHAAAGHGDWTVVTYSDPDGSRHTFGLHGMQLAGATRGGRSPHDAIAHYIEQDRMARRAGHARTRHDRVTCRAVRNSARRAA